MTASVFILKLQGRVGDLCRGRYLLMIESLHNQWWNHLNKIKQNSYVDPYIFDIHFTDPKKTC